MKGLNPSTNQTNKTLVSTSRRFLENHTQRMSLLPYNKGGNAIFLFILVHSTKITIIITHDKWRDEDVIPQVTENEQVKTPTRGYQGPVWHQYLNIKA